MTESVTDHGATGDGLDTAGVQRAIDTVHEAGGGTVRVPTGTYTCGGLSLRSNVTVRLEAGATLRPSLDPDDYGSRPTETGGTLEYPFLVAECAENVRIVGAGTIDGRAREQYDPDRVRAGQDGMVADSPAGDAERSARSADADTDDWPMAKPDHRVFPALSFADTTGVRLRDLTLRDLPAWTIFTNRCRDVVATGLTIDNDLRVPNADGIGLRDTKNVHISDCTIRGGDDCITPTATPDGPPMRNVTITNCSFRSSSCAVKIGSETTGDVRDVTVSNCTIEHTNRGVGIQHRDGGSIENVLFTDLTIETAYHGGPWWGKAEPIYVTSLPRDEGTTTGTVRNVHVTNVVTDAAGPIFLHASDGGTVENIRLNAIQHRGGADRGPTDAVGGQFDLQPTAVRDPVVEHEIPGLYCRGVSNLWITDVDIQWAGTPPEYCSSGVSCVETDGLVLDNVACGPAHSGDPAIELRSTRSATVRNCRATQGTGSFVRATDGSEERLFACNDCSWADRPIAGRHAFVTGLNVQYSGANRTSFRH